MIQDPHSVRMMIVAEQSRACYGYATIHKWMTTLPLTDGGDRSILCECHGGLQRTLPRCKRYREVECMIRSDVTFSADVWKELFALGH